MKKITICLTFLGAFLVAQATSFQVDYAVYIYNFTKYMSWPSSHQTGDFVIGVLGYSPLVKDLHHLAATKKKGNQEFIIKIFHEPQDFGKCHILFIPENHSADIEKCLALIGNKPTVVITEKAGMAKRGSCINLVKENGKIYFELNRTTAENIGVQVNNELVKMATMEIE